jgi:hypothetical protein
MGFPGIYGISLTFPTFLAIAFSIVFTLMNHIAYVYVHGYNFVTSKFK